MGRLKIHTPGPYSSIQDAGRTGYQALGVPEGGAVDPPARITANWLVSRPADAAGFEIFIGGLSFTTDSHLAVAMTGVTSDTITVTDASGQTATYAAGQTIYLHSGDTLTIPPLRSSNLAFLALSARLDLPAVFGSVGVSANARIGGLDGAMLKAGDEVSLTDITAEPVRRELSPELKDLFTPTDTFRVVPGPQDFCFETSEIDKLYSTDWRLTTRMDRMGLRLSGPALKHRQTADILSDGIVKGAVQIPGDGQPIILMADHQTTGGYTKIATVISADLARLTRLSPHKTIRFSAVSQQEAEEIARAQARLINTYLIE